MLNHHLTLYWYNKKEFALRLHKLPTYIHTLCRNLVGTHRIALKRIQKIC